MIGALLEALADVRLGLTNQIRQELCARITRNPTLGVKQAQRRGRDHRLFQRGPRVVFSCFQIGRGARLVAEWSGNEARQLPRMAVCKGNGYAVGSQIREAVNGISSKAGLGLFAVGDYGGPRSLKALDGVAQRLLTQDIERLLRDAAGFEVAHPFDQLRRPGNAADGLGRYRHSAS